MFESRKQEFSKEDVARWKEGAKNWVSFSEQMKKRDVQLSPHEERSIQALLLGEKPAFLMDKDLSSLAEELGMFGLKIRGDYIYNPQTVDRVRRKHGSLFRKIRNFSNAELMDMLSTKKEDGTPQHHAIRGVVLGFPLLSSKRFEDMSSKSGLENLYRMYELMSDEDKETLGIGFYTPEVRGNKEIMNFIFSKIPIHREALRLTKKEEAELKEYVKTMINSKSAGLEDMGWVCYGRDPESDQITRRLKAAFSLSGLIADPV